MSNSELPPAQRLKIRKILCPTDFSKSAQLAFDYAVALAEQLRAELVLLHSTELPDPPTQLGLTGSVSPEVRAQLEKLRPNSPKIVVSHVLHTGPAREVICWLAEQRECDLIIMGTHGRTGLDHLLFGSVAEYVVRHARCPVLTIRDRPANEPPLREPLVLPLPPPSLM